MKQIIGWGTVKFFVYVLGVAILYAVLLVGLPAITTVVSGKGLSVYSETLERDLSTYVIAAATLEFAVLTMLQQHMSRQQDRSLEFPDIGIASCELYTKSEKVYGRLNKIGKYKRGILIRIIYNETFPVYYVPQIHRAWVKKEIIRSEAHIREMSILSSTFNQNQKNARWELQVEALDYLFEAACRNQEPDVQELTFLCDVSLENQLLPWYNRRISRIYMRWVIHLESAGVRTDYGCCFNVKGLEIAGFGKRIPKKLLWQKK